jgi:hypothetical protein
VQREQRSFGRLARERLLEVLRRPSSVDLRERASRGRGDSSTGSLECELEESRERRLAARVLASVSAATSVTSSRPESAWTSAFSALSGPRSRPLSGPGCGPWVLRAQIGSDLAPVLRARERVAQRRSCPSSCPCPRDPSRFMLREAGVWSWLCRTENIAGGHEDKGEANEWASRRHGPTRLDRDASETRPITSQGGHEGHEDKW